MAEAIAIDIESYHADWEYLSPSKLEKLAPKWDRGEPIFAPHHFAAHRDGLIPNKTSDGLDLGSLVDAALTEPDSMSSRFDKGPCEDRRTKEWKDAEKAAVPKVLIQPSVWDAATAMCLAFCNNPHRPKTEPIHRQPTYKFERHGVKLKCRPDLEFEDRVCELKTTRHIILQDWIRDAFAYGYHRQAAFQRWATKKPIWHFVISSQPPHPCWAFRFTEDQLLLGDRQMDLLIKKFKECDEWDDWSAPGSKEVNVCQAPLWILPDAMANEIIP